MFMSKINTIKLFKHFLIFSICVSTQVVNAQIDSLALSRLKKQIDSLEKSELMSSGTVGFSLKNAKNQSILIENNAQKSLSPASTLKLITTAAILAALRPDFKYSTTLAYDGKIENGTLIGNLVIQGTGDPSLGSHRFTNDPMNFLKGWSFAIKSLGINQINGKIIIDNSYFEENPTPSRWLWGDIGNYYGAGASGINFRENFFTATILGAKSEKQNASVTKIVPELSKENIINKVSTDSPNTGDQVYIYSKPFDNQILLSGFAPQNQKINVKGTLPDPARVLAEALQKTLIEAGIILINQDSLTSQVQSKSLSFSNLQIINVVNSPTLNELITKCNHHSINLYAESFLKTLSVKNGIGNTNDLAIKSMINFWSKKGLNTRGFFPKDGSGLSPQNYVSTSFMTDVLNWMSNSEHFLYFLSSIPIVGQSGTVRSINIKDKTKIYAKSGSIEGTRAYAGYFYSKTGDLLSFSIMLNNYQKSSQAGKELEKIFKLMADI
jgi:D-alanyl-D-alanine carboxypeptidase/D-alanyl-D-alanine-endopeptidase (penicillin-binding protein 4)